MGGKGVTYLANAYVILVEVVMILIVANSKHTRGNLLLSVESYRVKNIITLT